MKRILCVADVKGWGGWIRGQYIQKYLSDEFKIDLLDMDEFGRYEKLVNNNIFTANEFVKFKNDISNDREVFDINEFKKYISGKRNKNCYDLIYFLFHTMLVSLKVRRIIDTGVKNITIVTGLPVIKPIFGDKQHFQKLTSKCSAIGANNNISLKRLKNHYKGKTFYACRGVDPEVFYSLSQKCKPKHDRFVVAYVGKPVPEKGMHIIQQACEIAGVRFMTNTRNFTNALGPDEMREFYNKADAYVVASTIDGSPNPALEAAACGKPIISNHIGNMPEFIKNGYNGFLLKKEQDRNVNKYAYWLKYLDENREKCFEMGLNARETILKSWTWEEVLENERKIFREVLNG